MNEKLRAWAPFLVSIACAGGIAVFKASEHSAAAAGAPIQAVAWVGDLPITAADVERRVALLASTDWASRDRADGQPEPKVPRDAAGVLESLIEEEVLFREGCERGMDGDETVRRHVINRLVEEEIFGPASAHAEDPSALRAFHAAHAAEFVKSLDEDREVVRRRFLDVETERLMRGVLDRLKQKNAVRYAAPAGSIMGKQS